MKISVLDKTGKDLGRQVSLSDGIFGIEPNDHAIYLDVKQYLANQRQGTHKSKEKAEIKGSTRKLKKQKGTGTARAGSIKSPIFRGGGRVFGPRPRNYGFKLNKKLKSLARMSALSYKAKDNQIKIIENFTLDTAKTKDYINILVGLSLGDKKSLLVLPADNKNIYLSSRNISNAQVTTVDQLNTYDVLKADEVILAEDAVKKFEELYLN